MPRFVDTNFGRRPADVEADTAAVTAARLLAFAITALLINFLVIDRSGSALSAGAATRTDELRAGTLALSDDDDGRTLFELTELLPGRPLRNCIAVDYAGSVLDGVAELRARGGGTLAAYLDVEILAGGGGRFGDCDGFVAEDTVYAGSLDELVQRHGLEGRPLRAFTIDAATERRVFQVTFTLRDDESAQGHTASVDFLWTVHA